MSILVVEKFEQTLPVALNELWEAKLFCDVVLIADDGETRIPAHRIVLAANSAYFCDILIRHDTTSMQELTVNRIDGVILEQLIKYCYTGQLVVDLECVPELLEAAAFLRLGHILNELHMHAYSIIDTSNCYQLMAITKNLQCSNLVQVIEKFFADNFSEIVEDPNFVNIDMTSLIRLLDNDKINVMSELDLFKNVLQWMSHDSATRQPYFPELLNHIRVASLPPKFILDHIEPLCNRELLKSVMRCCIAPEDITRLPKSWTKAREPKEVLVAVRTLAQTTEILWYCFKKQNWIPLQKLKDWYVGFAVALLNNSLYFAGGNLKCDYAAKVHKFNLYTKTLEEVAPVPVPCKDMKVGVNNGNLILLGGWVIDGRRIASNSVLRHRGSTCEQTSLMPSPKVNFAALSFEDSIYCIGGDENGNRSNEVSSYNLITNSWTKHRGTNQPRVDCGIFGHDDSLYIIGGGSEIVEKIDSTTEQWTEVGTVKGSQGVTVCVPFYNKVIAFGNGIVFEWNPKEMTWVRSPSIKPLTGFVVGCFTVPAAFVIHFK